MKKPVLCPVEVVSAVILGEGPYANRVLLTQRRPDRYYPMKWETPGGKIDRVDDHHREGAHLRALRRELAEELDLREIKAARKLFIVSVKDAQEADAQEVYAPIDMHVYHVEIVGKPKPMDGQGIGWFTATEIMGLDLADGTMTFRQSLVELCKKS